MYVFTVTLRISRLAKKALSWLEYKVIPSFLKMDSRAVPEIALQRLKVIISFSYHLTNKLCSVGDKLLLDSPKSKIIQEVTRAGKKKYRKPVVCEHDYVGYKDIVNLFDRSIIICGRLASAVVKMEKKFDTVKETVDYIYSNADKHIQERNKIITLLTQRLKKKGGLD